LDSGVSSTDQFGRRVVQACLIGAAFVFGGVVLWHASALVLLIFAGVMIKRLYVESLLEADA
jgi:hypothetical protein